MRSGLRIFTLAVLTAVGGLLVACSPAPEANVPGESTVEPTLADVVESAVEPPRSVPTSGAGAWCALAPPTLVNATLGIELREPTASFTSEEIRCNYLTVAEGELTIGVRFRVEQTHETFAAYRASVELPHEPTLDLPGVGDEAFYRTNEFDIQITQLVVARQGSVTVQLVAPGALADCADLVRAILAQLV